jgi:phosphomannomutase
MNIDTSIFKDYDIRGTYPDQLNGKVAKSIAAAIVRKFQPKTVAICRDMRTSGSEIRDALVEVFTKAGINVFDAGLTGTELAYYIAGTADYDMVIMISASHNPSQYNGLKMVLKGPVAVSGDTGLKEIKDLLHEGPLPDAPVAGALTQIDPFAQWKEKVLSLVDTQELKPLSVVVDAGNGMAGKLVPIVFEGLPLKVTPLYFELDGTFPHHTPNPLVESNNKELIAKVKELQADIGLTFDGDADRVFFVDNTGRFVSGSIITALLAKHYLQKNPGATILYSAVCGRIVPETVQKFGGKSERVRVGHSFMKAYMKEYKAVFAGEHSAHYYHQDYFNSESGVLTALMVLLLISTEGKKFSELVAEFDTYPSSGEINFKVPDSQKTIEFIRSSHANAKSTDELDGLSVWYDQYWFNIRVSKTEPLIRLNVEADTQELLKQKTDELISAIESQGGSIT